ncbi:ATP synthase F0 subunit C [Candidatus Babeliales bacterium]|nr:ATP synthase F0 subunit C [Candidatus Babeliales bacterium]
MIDVIYSFFSLLPLILSTAGTAIGQGLIGLQAIESIHKQPSSAQSISTLCIIATAITETASVIGLVIALLLLNDAEHVTNHAFILFPLGGIAAAIGLSGLLSGIASAYPAVASCQSLARQPFFQTKILNLMLITQTLIMTPNMFGMIIALLIKNQMLTVNNFSHAMQLLCSGLSIGLGCIGPCIGLAFFAYQACLAVGCNKKGYGKIVTFTFIGEAIIETPVIFALLIALLILNTTPEPSNLLQPWQFLAASLCIGLSTIAPGINLGITGAQACKQIAYKLEQYPSISKTALLGLAMIDTFTIYGLLMSVIMLLF